MHERTLIKAWFAEDGYRYTVVDTHDVAAAFAELRRVDAIAPALTHRYIRVTATQWMAGDPSFPTEALSFVGPDAIAQLEGAAR